MLRPAFQWLLGAAAVMSAPLCPATCLQDQYGNQYRFTQTENDAVIGTATNVQGCGAEWPLIGAYIRKNGGIQLELTVANPDPASCIPMYTLKGTYPNFGWYYVDGYGDQESTYAACGSEIVLKAQQGQGALR